MIESTLKIRTKNFAYGIVVFCRGLPRNREGYLIGNQLFRSGTSVGANYRAVCRARSKADFIAKLGIVEEEIDESLFWLEMLKELEVMQSKELDRLIKEADEILAMTVSSLKTAKFKE